MSVSTRVRERRGLARRPRLGHPAQIVVLAFGSAILLGTVLLMLPVSRAGPEGAPVLTALFTATSAVCVTGLVTVDTPGYWSSSGQVVILCLIQVGGLGIMSIASLIGVVLSRRMGLRTRLTTQTETKSLGLGDVRGVILGVVKMSLAFEAATAVLLTLRFAVGYDEPLGRAAYLGVFHAVSAFNNAGFALYSDSLVGFVSDPLICLPIAFAVIAGGLGFPVILELRRRLRSPKRWSLHTKLTVWTYLGLLIVGILLVTLGEWNNPRTLGALDAPDRALAGFFQAVMPRTAGFNTLDYGQMGDGTLLGTMALMFIGGGSAGTAGGIKVTTFILLFFIIWAEVRGEGEVSVIDRRIGERVQRQALTVTLLAIALVIGATLIMLELTGLPLRDALFETVSAFATVGLSTGITADLPGSAQVVLVVLMFVGRLGPITLVSSLALRDKPRRYSLPEGRPLIG